MSPLRGFIEVKIKQSGNNIKNIHVTKAGTAAGILVAELLLSTAP